MGDVKYKYFGGDWDRASFNQIVEFASGFEAEIGFIVGRLGAHAYMPGIHPITGVLLSEESWTSIYRCCGNNRNCKRRFTRIDALRNSVRHQQATGCILDCLPILQEHTRVAECQ